VNQLFIAMKKVLTMQLPTAVWGPQCINIIFISSDETRTDSFGRQIERRSSCCHKTMVQAHGNYWRFTDEERNAYHAPIE
jgi:N-acetyl-anhydromuramyl-L-alanine amidase AmpD